jgi:hypothetical protein
MEGTAQSIDGMPERIRDTMPFSAIAHHRTGIKATQIKSLVIEQALSLGIGGEQHLEAAVETVTILHVGSDSAADAAGSFEQDKRFSRVLQTACASQSGESGADDDG